MIGIMSGRRGRGCSRKSYTDTNGDDLGKTFDGRTEKDDEG